MPTIRDPDELAVIIDGKRFHFFEEMEIHLAIDSHATVGFSAPFEVERREFRDTFRPFSFKPLEVTVGGVPLFTGTLIDVNPRVEPDSRTVSVTGYSRPGVLDDSNAPGRLVPVEFNGLSIRQIAQRLLEPFGFGVVLEGPEGTPFKRVRINPSDKVQPFIAELAQQRGLVMSSTPRGDLLLQRSVAPGRPIARLEEGRAPVISVVPTFSPQEYFSEITGFGKTKKGRRGSKYTEQNTRLAGGALRACSFTLEDTETADAPAAVKAKMARMFGNMVAYVVSVPTWRDPQGKLWNPNKTLSLKAPNAMIYRETELLLRDVILRRNKDSLTTELGLMIPGAFSSEIPARLPWEE